MKPVFQTIIDGAKGDCMRATVASLLELELEQVPHFILFSDDVWWDVYCCFFYALGYDYAGYGKVLYRDYSINGFFDASVKSKTFPDKNHAVILDMAGVVVHDPNPNKLWLGENALLSDDFNYVYYFKRVDNEIIDG